MRLLSVLTAVLGGLAAAQGPNYRIYVASESGDIVTQLGWDGTALRTLKTVPVGIMPADIDGPHSVTVSPDGRFYRDRPAVSRDHPAPQNRHRGHDHDRTHQRGGGNSALAPAHDFCSPTFVS